MKQSSAQPTAQPITPPVTPPVTQTPAAPPAAVPAPPILAWVGLDWADKKHCLSVRTDRTGPTQTHFLEQKPAALDAFFLQLRAQHPQGRIAVAIEQSRGPVLYALLKYDFLALYPVNPRCLADYRRAFATSGAKDDPTDADLLGELVALHADRLRPLLLEDAPTRQLRLLTENRRDFVADRTRATNRLTATLKCYYPLALDFLRRWPNLAKLQTAKPSAVRAFFYGHNSRSEDKINARLEAVDHAKPLTEDPALVQPLQLQVACLVAALRAVQVNLAHYDERIAQVFATHSEAWFFAALPGAGPVLAPRLAAAFGTMRANFESAGALLSLSGVAPVKKQSGGMCVVHFRYARPVFLHQSLVEFAKGSIGQCEWAQRLYEHEVKQGKDRWVALRKLAFKWVRILWRCWQDRAAYDETRYLRGLQKAGVQLYEPLYRALPAEE